MRCFSTFLLLCAVGLAPASSSAQNDWEPAGVAATGRIRHTFNALVDGRGLVAGGKAGFFSGGLATAEWVDPATRVWTPAAPMGSARADHSSTTLSDGRVLVVGGCASGAPCNPPAASAEIYDPVGDRWTPAARPAVARALHAAILLPDGRVIVIGGQGTCNSQVCTTLSSTELYDPVADRWTRGPDLPQPRLQFTATPLDNGNVLVAGGCPTSGLPCAVLGSVVYDVAGNRFGAAAGMVVPRTYHLAVPLAGGDVLVAGGVDAGGYAQRSTEIYRSASNRWEAAPPSLFTHFGGAMQVLASGDVLLAGGSGPSAISELFRVADAAWSQVGSLATGREDPRMVRLAGGEMLVAGGSDASGNGIAGAERFRQGQTPLVALSPPSVDFGFQPVLQPGSPITVRVDNVGSAPLTVSAVAVEGTHAADFQVQSRCGAPVPPGGNCGVDLQFRPHGIKDRYATLKITDDAPNSPHAAPLGGFGYIDAPNFWAPAGAMREARAGHTLTALADGRALAVGNDNGSRRVEAFDAGVWRDLAPLSAVRSGPSVTLLADGRVLVAGGAVGLAAEVYDPATDAWTATGPMLASRRGHAAARLPSGEVIVFGGCATGPCRTTEVFSPVTGRWRPGPAMAVARSRPTATGLPGGRVLVAGGSTSDLAAEAYDPVADAMSGAGALRQPRAGHTASRLADGRVIVAGGCAGRQCVATEIYSPDENRWRPGPPMSLPRVDHVAAVLPDGRVVAAGGIAYCEPEFGFCFSTRAVDVYDPSRNRWKAFPILLEPRARFSAAVLATGQVLVSGGDDDLAEPRATAEILTPATR